MDFISMTDHSFHPVIQVNDKAAEYGAGISQSPPAT
jgi:hypothetical protein